MGNFISILVVFLDFFYLSWFVCYSGKTTRKQSSIEQNSVHGKILFYHFDYVILSIVDMANLISQRKYSMISLYCEKKKISLFPDFSEIFKKNIYDIFSLFFNYSRIFWYLYLFFFLRNSQCYNFNHTSTKRNRLEVDTLKTLYTAALRKK